MTSAVLDEIIALAGRDAADCLQRAFGGMPLYIPSAPGPDHPLRAAVGERATRLIVQTFAGCQIYVPQIPDRSVEELLRSGVPDNEIARRAGVSVRTVYRRKRQMSHGTLTADH